MYDGERKQCPHINNIDGIINLIHCLGNKVSFLVPPTFASIPRLEMNPRMDVRCTFGDSYTTSPCIHGPELLLVLQEVEQKKKQADNERKTGNVTGQRTWLLCTEGMMSFWKLFPLLLKCHLMGTFCAPGSRKSGTNDFGNHFVKTSSAEEFVYYEDFLREKCVFLTRVRYTGPVGASYCKYVCRLERFAIRLHSARGTGGAAAKCVIL